MVCDAGKDVAEPGLRIDIAQLGGADECVHDSGALPAAIRSAEQPRFTAKGHRPFILPMSGKRGKFTIRGIPTSGKKSPCGG